MRHLLPAIQTTDTDVRESGRTYGLDGKTVSPQITQGDDGMIVTQWSPDGTRIAFVSSERPRLRRRRNTGLGHPAEADAPEDSDHAESDNTPRWSPDGKTIAFIGQTEERAHPKIWLAPSTGGVPSVLAAKDLDMIPSDLEWSPDGRALYFNSGVRGEYQLFRVQLGSKETRAITSGPRAVRNMDLSPRAGRMVYTVNVFKHMDDLYVADLNARNERRLTNQRGALEAATATGCRALHVQGRGRLGHRRIFCAPRRMAGGQEVSDDSQHSRRPGQYVRRGLVS